METNGRENYNLKDEIEFCISGFLAHDWNKRLSVKVPKADLPETVIGDLRSFRILIRTLLEFGIKYCNDKSGLHKLEFRSSIDSAIGEGDDRSKVLGKFMILMPKNHNIDLGAIN